MIMNEQEIAKAIKIIREPITVHNETYHYFDQENYDKLVSVYDNCQWFINNQEQIMQNAIDNKKKADQLTNNWNELEEDINNKIKDIKTNFSQVNGNYFNMNYVIDTYEEVLDKMKEIKGG